VGMELIGYRLSADELQALLEDPATVSTLVYGDLDDPDAEMPEPELDLEKSWHGIHYLLTGTAWGTEAGAGAAILGGEEIGVDDGYGPARILRPELVRTIAMALDGLDLVALRARFDPAAMSSAGIYPDLWADNEFDTYLAPNFTKLRQFYQTAAANGSGCAGVVQWSDGDRKKLAHLEAPN
jgi:hypothetical protein